MLPLSLPVRRAFPPWAPTRPRNSKRTGRLFCCPRVTALDPIALRLGKRRPTRLLHPYMILSRGIVSYLSFATRTSPLFNCASSLPKGCFSLVLGARPKRLLFEALQRELFPFFTFSVGTSDVHRRSRLVGSKLFLRKDGASAPPLRENWLFYPLLDLFALISRAEKAFLLRRDIQRFSPPLSFCTGG